MQAKALDLSPAKRLKVIREVDFFHPWHSLDEKRYCLRCGHTMTGREIRIYPGSPGGMRYRLQCPTQGCPSVPIEWVMPEGRDGQENPAALHPGPRQRWDHTTIFGFLRLPQTFQ